MLYFHVSFVIVSSLPEGPKYMYRCLPKIIHLYDLLAVTACHNKTESMPTASVPVSIHMADVTNPMITEYTIPSSRRRPEFLHTSALAGGDPARRRNDNPRMFNHQIKKELTSRHQQHWCDHCHRGGLFNPLRSIRPPH